MPNTPVDDVDLFVLVRNIGSAARQYRYRSWPERVQSRCSVKLVHVASGRKVRAARVPIARREIARYFSKHGNRYDFTLAPGASAIIRLPRVTTARPGWGHKQELGFRYYPHRSRGAHSVSVTCVRYFGAGSKIIAGPLALTL